MLQAGGLIKLHYHRNFDSVLEYFDDYNGVLYYKGQSLYRNIQISSARHNHLTLKNDGLFVDGTFLDRFDYHDDELYFDDIIVSREYTDEIITNMVNQLWETNPYHQIGKVDYSYWIIISAQTDTSITYKNISETLVTIKITNPELQTLRIITTNGTTETTDIYYQFNVSSNTSFRIINLDNEALNIEIELL